MKTYSLNELIQKIMEKLESEKPFITISSNKISVFKKTILQYGW